ncbi:MAG: class I SAM-dependent methyltransferase [Planctomycetes bacterium]|nr:class I SAM-dependent methyltransferase [Planctomycetota bacterium]
MSAQDPGSSRPSPDEDLATSKRPAKRRARRPPKRPAKLDLYGDEDYAAQYDQRWASATGRKRDLRKARAITLALQDLQERCGKSFQQVMDLPCGTGRFSHRLASEFPTYFGADLSVQMLAEAKNKIAASSPESDRAHCNFLAADAAKLPFDDQAIDVTLCIRFLHLVRDPQLRIDFVRELARVSRYGVILDYRHDRTLRIWGKRVRHKLGLLELAPANPSQAQIRDEIRAAGLHAQRFIHVHRAPLLSDKMLVVTTPIGA